MSNVTVQEALKAAIDLLDKSGFIEEYEILSVKEQCRAALAEIDKCEPIKTD